MRRLHVFVEGQTERVALPTILAAFGLGGRTQPPLMLRGSKFFTQIGRRAAAILSVERDDHVFACPDLAPREHVPWPYEDYDGLQEALRQQVRREFRSRYGRKAPVRAMERFHPCPFRHDFEVILLAMPAALASCLRTNQTVEQHYNSRNPEDQDFDRYPKRVVRLLFEKFAKRRYDEVTDYPRVLDRATQDEVRGTADVCPRFAQFIEALRQAASRS